jgi:short-subunit dehydrogenase
LALSDINEEGWQQTVAGLPSAAVCLSTKLDVGSRDEIQAYAQQVLERYGKVDVVINNAGVGLVGNVREISDHNFDWLMNINMWGVINSSRAFLPALERRPEAWLVNISSVFGLVGIPGQTAYNTAKFAVRGFTEALWHEYDNRPLTVCCVHPGGIKTNIAASSRAPDSHSKEDFSSSIDRFQKMARTTPEQAADVIVDGMLKKRRRILIGLDAKIFHLASRLFPQRYLSVLMAIFRPTNPI